MSFARQMRRKRNRCALCGQQGAHQLVDGRRLCEACAWFESLPLAEQLEVVKALEVGHSSSCTCGEPGCLGVVVVRMPSCS